MAIIEVNHVTKEFQLGTFHSLRQSLLDILARVRGRPVAERAPFKALDDVDFKVEAGEVVGIIGRNGAGKSTLLKMLAGISSPTRGSVQVRGTVAPLIEVGAGLVPDLTGRENVYLNGVILGMRKAEIRQKFDEIVAFAELEEFIDTPIKRYSSGMQVRLGFAIATSVESDLLIVDEVLAVGDLAFQRKCFDRMEAMIKAGGKTVLLVSHNIRMVERICQRAILLDHGRIEMDGPPPMVCDEFYRRSDERSTAAKRSRQPRRQSSGEINLVDITVLDGNGLPVSQIAAGGALTVHVVYDVAAPLKRPVFGVGIHTPDFIYLGTAHSDAGLDCGDLEPGRYRISFHVRRFPFLPGVYCIRLGVAVGTLYSTAFYAENVMSFEVIAERKTWTDSSREGLVSLEGLWHLQPAAEAVGGEMHDEPRSEAAQLTNEARAAQKT